VKAVVKAIDEYLQSGKAPKYASSQRLVDRYHGIPTLGL
jgi:hypothetical protein